ncbi:MULTISPECIES: helix-turn-helix domain-containing protein [unclassified Haladaptatus]|uniref:helix-turn-helix domain-containing protein n=1 Tax=unclassified Haladaptatus TaxID=2622732 RepID=UPI00209BCB41|nr:MULTISPECIES: helix-turn-helix domain-containing protein [unclassified Haladaptatus]MCO8244340.1 helix-turn-helix domain-containing protein [Haladaptatus sp. AB643]MCO8254036.1 helix-turn-helix domain-containing protein [Haladaptatus sp. AB618]
MPTVHTKVEPQIGAVACLSRDHPNTTFRMLGNHPVDDGTVFVLLEAPDLPGEDVTTYFEGDDDVIEYEIIHDAETAVFVRIRIPLPAPHRAGISSGSVPHAALTVRNGWIHGEMTTSMERIQEFVSALREADVRYEVASLTQSDETGAILTERQQTVVETAVEHGYYETPRSCTLDDLADVLDVHRSTAGDVLNRAEGRIITSFVRDSS